MAMYYNPVKDVRLMLIITTVIILSFASLWWGEIKFSPQEFLQVFFRPDDSTASQIILHYRLPRTLAALLTGVSLPVSGWILQEFFRNPLAGPSVLGITSAAGLGVAIMVVLGASLGLGAYIQNPWILIVSALIGAFLAAFLLVGFAANISSSSTLIILGFMVAAICGSLVGILQFFASESQLKSYVLWGFGSLNGLTYNQLAVYFIVVFFALLGTLSFMKGLIGLQLGEFYGQTMGVNLKRTRVGVIIMASVLAAVSTAFVGPIAFVGLAIPHLCRIGLKTANFYKLFTYVIFVGMLFMLVFMLVAEFFPTGSLPINIVTSLFGAPIVISIILRKKYNITR